MTQQSISEKGQPIILSVDGQELEFVPVELIFQEKVHSDTFARKNNKTVAQTLTHDKYTHLDAATRKDYPDHLHRNLGEFLFDLKQKGDKFYREFLNKHGDESEYCAFFITDQNYTSKKGLYMYAINGKVKYIGRCLTGKSEKPNNFKRRINSGYGLISPKKCYLDGQRTNCYVNALIAKHKNKVEFYVYPMDDNEEIKKLEKSLIQKYNPHWNTTLKSSTTLECDLENDD